MLPVSEQINIVDMKIIGPLPASFARLSTAPDLPIFSLPARSTYWKHMIDMASR